jgi:hypothetical protein
MLTRVCTADAMPVEQCYRLSETELNLSCPDFTIAATRLPRRVSLHRTKTLTNLACVNSAKIPPALVM